MRCEISSTSRQGSALPNEQQKLSRLSVGCPEGTQARRICVCACLRASRPRASVSMLKLAPIACSGSSAIVANVASPVVAWRGISRAVEALSSLFLLMAPCLSASAFVHGPIQVSIGSRCVGV